jgi:hypothetical protein
MPTCCVERTYERAKKKASHTANSQHGSELETLAHRIVTCENTVEDVCTKLTALEQADAYSIPVRLMNIAVRSTDLLATHAEGSTKPSSRG